MTTVYLALGSNLGDRAALLREAAARLDATGLVHVRGRSPLYETDAVAEAPQPPYLNAALRAETELAPRALLELCLAIERAMGRVRPPGRGKAPRTIDIDVLLHGDAAVDEPGLRLPHPELLARAFVRIPLADVAASGLTHPLSREPLDRAAPAAAVRLFGAF